MNKQIIPLSFLADYVGKEETGYQVANELVEIARGCVRHCPFCINKLEKQVLPYSKIQRFLDEERDDHNRLVRPNIYLWDDNFLAADKSVWQPLLQELIDTKRPFQFRQGLDERMIAA